MTEYPLSDAPCGGVGSLRTTKAFEAATKKKLTLGSKAFFIPAGQTKRVRVWLSSKARRLLKKQKRLGARLTVTVGGSTASLTRNVTLKARKKRK